MKVLHIIHVLEDTVKKELNFAGETICLLVIPGRKKCVFVKVASGVIATRISIPKMYYK